MGKENDWLEEEKKVNEHDKEQALKMIREWIEKLPDELRDQPFFGDSTKEYSPMQYLAEVEKGTEEGKRIINSLREVRQRAERLRQIREEK
jgi:hypothetical protein